MYVLIAVMVVFAVIGALSTMMALLNFYVVGGGSVCRCNNGDAIWH